MTLGQAPKEIPEGLSAREYYTLGTWYGEEGNLDKCREVLQRAISIEPDGETARSARFYLAQNIPRNVVPMEAINSCRELSRHGQVPENAIDRLKQLSKDFPTFEWPLKYLADVHLRNGDTKTAVSLLRLALEINPDYAGALSSLSQAFIAEMAYDEATRYINEALAIVPEDDSLRKLKEALEVVIALDGTD